MSGAAGAARARRLGFAVKVLDRGGLPSHDTRRWRSGPHLRHSLDCLEAIVARLAADDVRMYRMSSDLVPYATHPELPQFHRQVEECGERLAAVGEQARAARIRLSFHPGQYVVLNSEDADVRRAAVRDLELAAAVLDALGAGPEAVVVLHVGGGAGGTEAALDRFRAGAELLSPAARARLVVENDDRRFGLRDVLSLAERERLRVVWDVHHHRCHDPDRIPEREALALALATWRDSGTLPKIHWSSPRTSVEERSRRVGRRVERTLVLPPLRAHADLVDPIAFAQFLTGPGADGDYDVMLEAKAKDVALLRLRDQLSGWGFGWEDGRLLVPEG